MGGGTALVERTIYRREYEQEREDMTSSRIQIPVRIYMVPKQLLDYRSRQGWVYFGRPERFTLANKCFGGNATKSVLLYTSRLLVNI